MRAALHACHKYPALGLRRDARRALYPIHSGEWGGVATRLPGTMTFGLRVWLGRRPT